jgi:hypothetical protein
MAHQWFRLYSEFAADPKVQSMSEAMQRRLVMVLCIRSSNVLETLHEEEIAFFLRLSAEELAATKSLFVRKGFIDETWSILNWDKRQYASDSSTDRVRRFREAKKLHDETKGNVSETPPDTDTDTDTDALSNPNGLEVGKDSDAPKRKIQNCPVQKIIDLYHEILLPELPAVEKVTKTREGYIRQRWLQDLQELDHWRNYFQDVRRSNFLMGRVDGRDGKPPFRADLEWLTRPGNFTKVAEGKYHR